VAETKAKKVYHWGTGRRKTAVARVRLLEGTGKIEVNKRPLSDYFTEEKDRAAIIGPLELTDMRGRLDVLVNVRGGGITGQAGAISQGVARALKVMFGLTEPEPTPAAATDDGEAAPAEVSGGVAKKLRDSGYLTRDGRMKERKKYGRKGARKSFQFSKR
jgi:small subunit ribosomal protein S9